MLSNQKLCYESKCIRIVDETLLLFSHLKNVFFATHCIFIYFLCHVMPIEVEMKHILHMLAIYNIMFVV